MHNGKNSNNFGWKAMTICDKKKLMLSQVQKNALAVLGFCFSAHPHCFTLLEELYFLKIAILW